MRVSPRVVKYSVSAFTFPRLRNVQVRGHRKNTDDDVPDFIYFLCNTVYSPNCVLSCIV